MTYAGDERRRGHSLPLTSDRRPTMQHLHEVTTAGVLARVHRFERQARRARAGEFDLGRVQPSLLERTSGPSQGIAALAPPAISAVIAKLEPGIDSSRASRALDGWTDVTAYTDKQQASGSSFSSLSSWAHWLSRLDT